MVSSFNFIVDDDVLLNVKYNIRQYHRFSDIVYTTNSAVLGFAIEMFQ